MYCCDVFDSLIGHMTEANIMATPTDICIYMWITTLNHCQSTTSKFDIQQSAQTTVYVVEESMCIRI